MSGCDIPLPVGDICIVQALADVKQVIDEWGSAVIIQLRQEPEVTRDKYNSLKKRGTPASIPCNAYPVEYNPNEYQIEKAGLRENVEVIIYTAFCDYTNNSVGFDDIEMKRSTVILAGQRYEIRDKRRFGQIQDTWLYIVLGLNKL